MWVHFHAAARDGNGPPSLNAVEEPLLHRVVVQRAIDVHRADAGPVDATLLQQLLRVQLALQGRSERRLASCPCCAMALSLPSSCSQRLLQARPSASFPAAGEARLPLWSSRRAEVSARAAAKFLQRAGSGVPVVGKLKTAKLQHQPRHGRRHLNTCLCCHSAFTFSSPHFAGQASHRNDAAWSSQGCSMHSFGPRWKQRSTLKAFLCLVVDLMRAESALLWRQAHTLCLLLGSVASSSLWGIWSDLRYTPAEEQKMYCWMSPTASRTGSTSLASLPFMSYTTAAHDQAVNFELANGTPALAAHCWPHCHSCLAPLVHSLLVVFADSRWAMHFF